MDGGLQEPDIQAIPQRTQRDYAGGASLGGPDLTRQRRTSSGSMFGRVHSRGPQSPRQMPPRLVALYSTAHTIDSYASHCPSDLRALGLLRRDYDKWPEVAALQPVAAQIAISKLLLSLNGPKTLLGLVRGAIAGQRRAAAVVAASEGAAPPGRRARRAVREYMATRVAGGERKGRAVSNRPSFRRSKSSRHPSHADVSQNECIMLSSTNAVVTQRAGAKAWLSRERNFVETRRSSCDGEVPIDNAGACGRRHSMPGVVSGGVLGKSRSVETLERVRSAQAQQVLGGGADGAASAQPPRDRRRHSMPMLVSGRVPVGTVSRMRRDLEIQRDRDPSERTLDERVSRGSADLDGARSRRSSISSSTSERSELERLRRQRSVERLQGVYSVAPQASGGTLERSKAKTLDRMRRAKVERQKQLDRLRQARMQQQELGVDSQTDEAVGAITGPEMGEPLVAAPALRSAAKDWASREQGVSCEEEVSREDEVEEVEMVGGSVPSSGGGACSREGRRSSMGEQELLGEMHREGAVERMRRQLEQGPSEPQGRKPRPAGATLELDDAPEAAAGETGAAKAGGGKTDRLARARQQLEVQRARCEAASAEAASTVAAASTAAVGETGGAVWNLFEQAMATNGGALIATAPTPASEQDSAGHRPSGQAGPSNEAASRPAATEDRPSLVASSSWNDLLKDLEPSSGRTQRVGGANVRSPRVAGTCHAGTCK